MVVMQYVLSRCTIILITFKYKLPIQYGRYVSFKVAARFVITIGLL